MGTHAENQVRVYLRVLVGPRQMAAELSVDPGLQKFAWMVYSCCLQALQRSPDDGTHVQLGDQYRLADKSARNE